MNIIKEYVKFKDNNKARVIFRTDTYGSNMQFFLDLSEDVRKYFPDIVPGDMAIYHYGGERYRGTYGIEFNVDIGTIPACFESRREVEKTL